jgi:hypothetical protein
LLVMSPLPMSSARNCNNCFFELNVNMMIKCYDDFKDFMLL